MRVLVVDDHEAVREHVAALLRADGHDVAEAADGVEALLVADQHSPALVVLDIAMPGIDGLEVCRRLRRRRPGTGVLLLTGRSGDGDELDGFAALADDYVTKPFQPAVLLARVQALGRRLAAAGQPLLPFGLAVLDQDRHRLLVDGVPVPTTPQMFGVASYLAGRPDQVVSKRALLRAAWPDGSEVTGNAVERVVAQLRRHVEPGSGGWRYLRTERGYGYRFRPDGAA